MIYNYYTLEIMTLLLRIENKEQKQRKYVQSGKNDSRILPFCQQCPFDRRSSGFRARPIPTLRLDSHFLAHFVSCTAPH